MKHHVLLSNDDGIGAPGLYSICKALYEEGFEVTVAAPLHERSGAGHALTIHNPLRAVRRELYKDVRAYAIDGTPADCVKLGVRKLAESVDLVVSGINNGENLGKDTHYSGTVSAAIEGIFCGYPALAVSLSSFTGEKDYTYAAQTGARLAKWLIANPLRKGTMLNLNVPNLPKEEIEGFAWAGLSGVGYTDDYERRDDPYGRPYYWIRGAYEKEIPGGDDLDMLRRGYMTLTPITWDMTDREEIERLKTNSLSEFI